MEKNVKINLNGKTISANTSNVDETAYAFRIEDGCSLTINGNGVVNGGSGCAKNIASLVRLTAERKSLRTASHKN